MLTNADARRAVITAIEANGTDVASREEYDIDAIVHDIYQATSGYDVDAVDAEEFWAIVERHELRARAAAARDAHNARESREFADRIDARATDLRDQLAAISGGDRWEVVASHNMYDPAPHPRRMHGDSAYALSAQDEGWTCISLLDIDAPIGPWQSLAAAVQSVNAHLGV